MSTKDDMYIEELKEDLDEAILFIESIKELSNGLIRFKAQTLLNKLKEHKK